MPERRPRADRAQQFMPFAALKGYYDLIRERERVAEPKRELTDEQKAWIDEGVEECTKEEREVVYRMFKESKEKVIADGAEVTNFEDVDIDAFKALALPIQDKFAQDNNMTAELEMIRAAAE